MTELAERLQKDIDGGRSIREIGRRAGMSNSTVRRALQGKELDHNTIAKLAAYLKLPTDEVYRMAGVLPSRYDADGNFNRDWLLSQIWEQLLTLTNSERAEVLVVVLRLAEKHAAETRED